jgi:hypothetical protein
MKHYSEAVVERRMKIQEVILRAMAGKLQWWQAAEILGVSDRTMRRWRWRYSSTATMDSMIAGRVSRVLSECPWRRWRRCCSCIDRNMPITTCVRLESMI